MAGIYDRHRAAFSMVSAYVVMDGVERRATVAFKFANSVSVYVHWIGQEMTRGTAGGGGYDRQSAACSAAARKMAEDLSRDTYADGTPHHTAEEMARYAAFRAAMLADDGFGWDRRLRDAGFNVLQAI